jgi:PPOX class probable F420-dependent enzyme
MGKKEQVRLTLADVAAMLKQQPYAVVSTIRPSGTIQSTLVNVGIYADGVGFTTVGQSRKEYNLTRNPACTVTIHHGPYWITVEGKARLYTWDNTDPETMRCLLRELYVAAGGTHDDWDTYDRVIREERRAAVVVMPERIYVRRPRQERG